MTSERGIFYLVLAMDVDGVFGQETGGDLLTYVSSSLTLTCIFQEEGLSFARLNINIRLHKALDLIPLEVIRLL
ncbi:hypothetical protein BJX62DRAFT_206375 [Aspergillus germanicus]